MQAYVWWFVLAFVLAGAELLTGTFYLLVIALAAAAGGVVAAASGALAWQLVVAAVIGVGGSLWLRQRRGRAGDVSDQVQHPDIGQSVRIDGWSSSGTARTQYRGAVWDVELAAGETAAPGDYVIRAISSNRLIVARRAVN
ncbi:MAG: NfeD family protein [Burkholderiaceae bacterium]